MMNAEFSDKKKETIILPTSQPKEVGGFEPKMKTTVIKINNERTGVRKDLVLLELEKLLAAKGLSLESALSEQTSTLEPHDPETENSQDIFAVASQAHQEINASLPDGLRESDFACHPSEATDLSAKTSRITTGDTQRIIIDDDVPARDLKRQNIEKGYCDLESFLPLLERASHLSNEDARAFLYRSRVWEVFMKFPEIRFKILKKQPEYKALLDLLETQKERILNDEEVPFNEEFGNIIFIPGNDFDGVVDGSLVNVDLAERVLRRYAEIIQGNPGHPHHNHPAFRANFPPADTKETAEWLIVNFELWREDQFLYSLLSGYDEESAEVYEQVCRASRKAIEQLKYLYRLQNQPDSPKLPIYDYLMGHDVPEFRNLHWHLGLGTPTKAFQDDMREQGQIVDASQAPHSILTGSFFKKNHAEIRYILENLPPIPGLEADMPNNSVLEGCDQELTPEEIQWLINMKQTDYKSASQTQAQYSKQEDEELDMLFDVGFLRDFVTEEMLLGQTPQKSPITVG